jgi:hypothetical protein
MAGLRCVFCGVALAAAGCVWVQLPDGADFVCCPVVCPPMREAIEAHRRQSAADRQQLLLPLGAA